MKKIALLTLLLINLSLSFSLPRNQASPAIFSVTKTNNSILFRHTDSTLTAIPCQSVASIVSNADPSKIVSVWVVQQGDYDKIMQFDYSVCGFSSKSDAVDSLTAWAICDTSSGGGGGGGGVSQSALDDSLTNVYTYINNNIPIITDSATITDYTVINSQNAPPGSPAIGDTYLVGTVPTGVWVGHAKDIAEWNGSAWVFTDGVQGDFLYNATNALTYIFRSGNWVQTTGIPALNNGNNISGGLKIGTNNARSLTFETNNVNRGRFDSVGRFHIYNLPTSSTSDTFVTKSDLSGKLTKVGQSTFLSGVNTSLFPNGQEIVTESRDFRDSDIDKLLIIVGNDITLTMPDSIVFSEQGRTIGLKFLQGYTGCGYQASHGFTTKALQLPNDGEFITLITGEYLGKSSVGSIANMQVNTDDGIVTLNKYLYDKVNASGSGRSVDTIYKNSAKDSIVFTISGIRYAVKDSFNLNTDSQTLSISNDTLTISGGNSVILPVYIQIDSATITSYDVLNSQNTPPVSPSTGDVYLVGTVPTGAWVGQAKDIAEWDGADWVFTDGVQGDFLYNATNALTYIFRSGNWVQTTGIPALHNGNNISSGLRIGTNNARSLTFETNNVNRGRFDSVGRFHIYNLPTSSTSDTFVTKSDLSGKLTKVGQSTFLAEIAKDNLGVSYRTDSIRLYIKGSTDTIVFGYAVRGLAYASDTLSWYEGGTRYAEYIGGGGGSGYLTFNDSLGNPINDTTKTAFRGGNLVVNGIMMGRGRLNIANNTAFGSQALNLSNTANSYLSAFGSYALSRQTTGAYNNAFGYSALHQNIINSYLNAFGTEALYNTKANDNSGFGYRAGYSNIVGTNNAYFGNNAGYAGLGSYNSFFGDLSGRNYTGSYGTGCGQASLFTATTGSQTAIGANALYSTTGANNIGVGFQAGQGLTSGANNVLIGMQSGILLSSTGSNNVLIGHYSGNVLRSTTNTMVGYQSGNAVTVGAKNTYLGAYTGSSHVSRSKLIVLSDGDGTIGMLIDSVQRVGIGNVVPTAKLSVQGSATVSTSTPSAPDAAAVLEVQSTTQGFRLVPMTATQASAITAVEGLMLFVSDTNGTFTSIGLWCYENGAWSKK